MTEAALDPRIERTRELVIDAALELLANEGPEAVTHQRVAERAGVGRATVYRHWPDPWALIMDAFGTLALKMSPPTDLPVRDSLIVVLEMLCDRLDSPLSLAMASLIARAEWQLEARTFLGNLVGRASSEIAGLLERGAIEEGLELDMPVDSALSLIAGPFFYERFLSGAIRSRDQIPAHVDTLLKRWGALG